MMNYDIIEKQFGRSLSDLPKENTSSTTKTLRWIAGGLCLYLTIRGTIATYRDMKGPKSDDNTSEDEVED